MAECSESTGTISAPHSLALRMTILPAHTSVSLLASAMRRPFSMAASVGRRPTAPDTAVTTASVSEMTAASHSAFSPPPTAMSVSASAMRSALADASSVTATNAGCRRRACSSASWMLRFVVSARTFSPRCSATATVCRPMLPVEPRMEIECTIAMLLYCATTAIAGASSTSSSSMGAVKMVLSNRSSIPP